MRTGVRLGLDVGTVRIGVARSDERGIVCLPVETVHVQRDHSEIDDLLDIIDEYDQRGQPNCGTLAWRTHLYGG